MTQNQKATLFEKLTALTEGPTPLYHHVSLQGEMVAITVQPWGSPMYLSWTQAVAFANALPLEIIALQECRV